MRCRSVSLIGACTSLLIAATILNYSSAQKTLFETTGWKGQTIVSGQQDTFSIEPYSRTYVYCPVTNNNQPVPIFVGNTAENPNAFIWGYQFTSDEAIRIITNQSPIWNGEFFTSLGYVEEDPSNQRFDQLQNFEGGYWYLIFSRTAATGSCSSGITCDTADCQPSDTPFTPGGDSDSDSTDETSDSGEDSNTNGPDTDTENNGTENNDDDSNSETNPDSDSENGSENSTPNDPLAACVNAFTGDREGTALENCLDCREGVCQRTITYLDGTTRTHEPDYANLVCAYLCGDVPTDCGNGLCEQDEGTTCRRDCDPSTGNADQAYNSCVFNESNPFLEYTTEYQRCTLCRQQACLSESTEAVDRLCASQCNSTQPTMCGNFHCSIAERQIVCPSCPAGSDPEDCQCEYLCPQDCGPVEAPSVDNFCGNDICDARFGEDTILCPPCPEGTPADECLCRGICEQDCGILDGGINDPTIAHCGNAVCEEGEQLYRSSTGEVAGNCPQDCPVATCGDGLCHPDTDYERLNCDSNGNCEVRVYCVDDCNLADIPTVINDGTCSMYYRENEPVQYCAICGDNQCEPWERCMPTSCTNGVCSNDCGPLACAQDCGGLF